MATLTDLTFLASRATVIWVPHSLYCHGPLITLILSGVFVSSQDDTPQSSNSKCHMQCFCWHIMWGPCPFRLQWREAVTHFQLWFQTPAMIAGSSSDASEGLAADNQAVDDWLFLSAESALPQHPHASTDEPEVEDKGKLKSKLVSAWNSVKYGLFLLFFSTGSILIFFFFHETHMFSCFRLVFQTKVKICSEFPCGYAWKVLWAQGTRSGMLTYIILFCVSLLLMFWSFFLLTSAILSGEKERFRSSFASLLWLTYRRGYPHLPGSSLTTDSGWGCVLRTSQMLLARGLFLHLMPPGNRNCWEECQPWKSCLWDI